MRNFFKKTNDSGQLVKLGFSTATEPEQSISKTEYCMMKCAIKIFINGEDPEKIKSEEWWQ